MLPSKGFPRRGYVWTSLTQQLERQVSLHRCGRQSDVRDRQLSGISYVKRHLGVELSSAVATEQHLQRAKKGAFGSQGRSGE